MKKIIILTTVLLIFLNSEIWSQVRIGASGTPPLSAMLELQSDNRGFLPPRVNLTNLTMNLNGGVPADGMIIYSTNTNTGTGLFVWHSGSWNRLVEQLDTTTYARFIGKNSSAINNAIPWEPVLIKQPGALSPIWQANTPELIYIRTAGLYIISASYRQQVGTGREGSIYLKLNGNTDIQETRYFNRSSDVMTPTFTTMQYFEAGDFFAIHSITGSTDNTLGTTQLTISQIPMISY
ncbi:MAG: hypothetical protein EOO85_13225 [Pedobacter sp.]|nr:MAG: hypothetical protein EOO85_13225 [Pedobacter sp.]